LEKTDAKHPKAWNFRQGAGQIQGRQRREQRKLLSFYPDGQKVAKDGFYCRLPATDPRLAVILELLQGAGLQPQMAGGGSCGFGLKWVAARLHMGA
jgi:hypothetical protein